MNLKEIKQIHQVFCVFNSCKEFSDYIKALIENKKLSIKLTNQVLYIIFTVEYLFKQNTIEITLNQEKVKLEDIIADACKEISLIKEKLKFSEDNLNNKIKKQNDEITILKNENNELKKQIKEIKEENSDIKAKLEELIKNSKMNNYISNIIYNMSTIIKPNEFKMINFAIEKRIGKIKNIKKLYQATIDGGDPINFHKKCDNINNTLVLIKSRNNTRFGGFTSKCWKSAQNETFEDDRNAFIFSLDKQEVYSYKNDGKAIRYKNSYGPCFGYGPIIGIYGNPIKDRVLWNYPKNNVSYDFDGNFTFEEEKINSCYVSEYEVFQLIFY